MIGYVVYRHDGSIYITNDELLAVSEVSHENSLFPERGYPVVRILRGI